jgi:hypothetical protein
MEERRTKWQPREKHYSCFSVRPLPFCNTPLHRSSFLSPPIFHPILVP